MLAAIFALANIHGPAITTKTLLEQMTDRGRIATLATPHYRTEQASSYDRASLTPGNDAWFANADYGKFLRSETIQGRSEMVMADLKGPGAVVRIWSANPLGTIRFYFDGEASPRLAAPMADLLSGKLLQFTPPFAYVASRGCNLYFPFPYAQSLKITVEDPTGQQAKALYYQIGYRSYQPPAPNLAVQSWNSSDVTPADMDRIAKSLNETADPAEALARETTYEGILKPGNQTEVKLTRAGAGLLTELTLGIMPTSDGVPFTQATHPAQQLRHLMLECDVDGVTTVRVPAADFFGCAPLPHDARNTFMTTSDITESGPVMQSRWVMPFRQNMTIRLVNRGKTPVNYRLAAKIEPHIWTDQTLVFRAEWRNHGVGTRPMADMRAMEFRGQGRFVGLALHVANRTPAWWGEGDEKVWVDGEAFPSTFGTGTEDYFGYAWCDPTPFSAPYHAQPVAGKPANFGHTSNVRWHILDDIPFTKSFIFDLEKWHWQDAETSFATTAFWYAKPDRTPARPIPDEALALLETVPPKPVEGAIEGETMEIIERKGGTTERQGGYWGLSADEQLWWQDAPVGGQLRLTVSVPKAGRYQVIGNFCHAVDYGRHRLSIGGQRLGDHDFYGQGVTWKRLELGTVALTAGEHEFVVEVLGSNPLAEPKRHMFGLDYMLIKPVD